MMSPIDGGAGLPWQPCWPRRPGYRRGGFAPPVLPAGRERPRLPVDLVAAGVLHDQREDVQPGIIERHRVAHPLGRWLELAEHASAAVRSDHRELGRGT